VRTAKAGMPELLQRSCVWSDSASAKSSQIVDTATKARVLTVTHDLAEEGVLLSMAANHHMMGRLETVANKG